MATDEESTSGNTASDQSQGKSNLADLSADPAHLFDQTNGIVDGLDGDGDQAPEDDGTLFDRTLSGDETRQRSDDDGRLS